MYILARPDPGSAVTAEMSATEPESRSGCGGPVWQLPELACRLSADAIYRGVLYEFKNIYIVYFYRFI